MHLDMGRFAQIDELQLLLLGLKKQALALECGLSEIQVF